MFSQEDIDALVKRTYGGSEEGDKGNIHYPQHIVRDMLAYFNDNVEFCEALAANKPNAIRHLSNIASYSLNECALGAYVRFYTWLTDNNLVFTERAKQSCTQDGFLELLMQTSLQDEDEKEIEEFDPIDILEANSAAGAQCRADIDDYEKTLQKLLKEPFLSDSKCDSDSGETDNQGEADNQGGADNQGKCEALSEIERIIQDEWFKQKHASNTASAQSMSGAQSRCDAQGGTCAGQDVLESEHSVSLGASTAKLGLDSKMTAKKDTKKLGKESLLSKLKGRFNNKPKKDSDNEQTGNEQTGGEQSGDEKTGAEKIGGEKTGERNLQQTDDTDVPAEKDTSERRGTVAFEEMLLDILSLVQRDKEVADNESDGKKLQSQQDGAQHSIVQPGGRDIRKNKAEEIVSEWIHKTSVSGIYLKTRGYEHWDKRKITRHLISGEEWRIPQAKYKHLPDRILFMLDFSGSCSWISRTFAQLGKAAIAYDHVTVAYGGWEGYVQGLILPDSDIDRIVADFAKSVTTYNKFWSVYGNNKWAQGASPSLSDYLKSNRDIKSVFILGDYDGTKRYVDAYMNHRHVKFTWFVCEEPFHCRSDMGGLAKRTFYFDGTVEGLSKLVRNYR